MKQLFKSDLTGKVYDSEKECLEAEKAHNELLVKEREEKEERKSAADAIKSAYEDYLSLCTEDRKKEKEAYNKYLKLRNGFVDRYGSYHLTVTKKNDLEPVIDFGFDSLNNLVQSFFNNFWAF